MAPCVHGRKGHGLGLGHVAPRDDSVPSRGKVPPRAARGEPGTAGGARRAVPTMRRMSPRPSVRAALAALLLGLLLVPLLGGAPIARGDEALPSSIGGVEETVS